MKENEIKNLFKGIYESIVDAQKEVEESFTKRVFSTYFDSEGSPKTIEVNLGGKLVQVPIFSLLPHNNIKISEVTFDMQVRIEKQSQSFFHKIFFNHKKNNAQLNIKFKEDTVPEGIARINDILSNISK